MILWRWRPTRLKVKHFLGSFVRCRLSIDFSVEAKIRFNMLRHAPPNWASLRGSSAQPRLQGVERENLAAACDRYNLLTSLVWCHQMWRRLNIHRLICDTIQQSSCKNALSVINQTVAWSFFKICYRNVAFENRLFQLSLSFRTWVRVLCLAPFFFFGLS